MREFMIRASLRLLGKPANLAVHLIHRDKVALKIGEVDVAFENMGEIGSRGFEDSFHVVERVALFECLF